jgi:predicted amidohydrolase YtcJ
MTDLILYNANVITLDPGVGKAGLVAIKDGRIQAVSPDSALRDFKQKQTRLVDCGGQTLLPGFCDAHFHLWASAAHLLALDLSPHADVSSIMDMQAKIHAFAKTLAPGTWIRAAGYNEFYLAEKRHPTRKDLDQAAPNHPVKLTHRSCHAHVLNSRALKQVGISRYTSEPPGGLIDRYADTGEPNGILFEMNTFLSDRVPMISDPEFKRGIRLLNQKLLSTGITSIHEASFNNARKQWEALCALKVKKEFLPRVTMALGVSEFRTKNTYPCPVEREQLRVSSVKIIVDETTGRLYPAQKELDRLVLGIHQAGMQAAIHAIEETAVESACQAIESALENIPNPNHRHRIEHCSACTPSLAKRLAASNIMVVTQPAFIYYHGDRYLKTIADEDMANLYPFGTLQKSGVTVIGSSDSPIVEPSPITGIYAAISRRAKTGAALSVEEGLDALSALEMFTGKAAKASFDEDVKGTITPGKLADLVLLSGDLTKAACAEVKDIKVVMTVIDGEIVWKAG